ncbi:MAG TPA: peptide ABC transporter permease [Deltaproteobacteria bacterium]|nr:peptide ABC transporter permease [Deltaproteobacteria bacterium]
MVGKQFKRSRLNRLGLFIILFTALLAIFAPILANGEPVYVRYEGKIYFPILQKIWPLSRMKLYPELRDVDYGTWEQKGATVRYTLVPYSPNDYDLNSILLPPSPYHWMGTDEQGRDVLSRMIHGSRISLSVGLVAVSIYTLIGIFLGALAGYFGGKSDLWISRLIEIMICFPTFFLVLTLLAILGPSIYYIMLVIGLTGWTGIARLVRGEFLKLRDQDFVTACRSQGMSTGRILFRHILPNGLAPVLVSATFGIASAILIESSLSFLGFGVQPPTPSWGDLLSQSRDFIDIAWWLTLFPGIAIFATITSFNLVGEGLRDAADPKLKT